MDREYLVVLGNNHYNVERVVNSCKHRFNTLRAARQFAKQYTNAYVFKVTYGDDLAPLDIIDMTK